MLVIVAGLTIALLPFAVIAGMLHVVERLDRRRVDSSARQIALTNAIHMELGAVAAPTVSRRVGGPWRVSIGVPFEHRDTVASIVGITDRVFGARPDAEPFQIILTPRQPWAIPREPRPVSSRAAFGRSVAAVR